MIKIVIWIGLNAQSVCMCQLFFLDSMMFYRLRGFQRLQFCNFWTDRIKDKI
jgi:hypothetical protein